MRIIPMGVTIYSHCYMMALGIFTERSKKKKPNSVKQSGFRLETMNLLIRPPLVQDWFTAYTIQ
jgi:hypothetical protein